MAERTRVIVGVSGSLSSLTALHQAVEEARLRDAVLVPVLAWTPAGGELEYRRRPCPRLLEACEQAARKRLDTAFEQAFGGYPEGLVVQPMVVRCRNAGQALVEIANRPDDLLVVSTGRLGRLGRMFHSTVSRYVRAHAVCGVVPVPPSELLETLERATRDGERNLMPRLRVHVGH